jgi:hypothetical protein
MNDRGGVKSPENPGFKPKNDRGFAEQEERARGATPESGTADLSALGVRKPPAFRKKRVKLTKKWRKLRGLGLTGTAYGASVPRFSG